MRGGELNPDGTPTWGNVIPLSPIDHVFTGRGAYPLEFVFAYGDLIDPDRLAESLRRTLALFPAVASRLVRVSDEAYGLEPADDGCAFGWQRRPRALPTWSSDRPSWTLSRLSRASRSRASA